MAGSLHSTSGIAVIFDVSLFLSASSLLKFAFAEPPLPGFVNRVALSVACIVISFSLMGSCLFAECNETIRNGPRPAPPFYPSERATMSGLG